MEAALVVARVGMQATVQDLGRPGLAHLAVSRSGAADDASLRLGNRLVGNPEHLAGLECTLLGATLELTAPRWIAVTGAECEVAVGGRAAQIGRPQYVAAGEPVTLGPARRGLRTYLAVAGGVAVPPVLGSRSTDTFSVIGPAPLAAGRRLPVGPPVGAPAPVDLAVQSITGDDVDVRLLRGPRHALFTSSSIETLVTRPYSVTDHTDRVGVRLAGAALERADAREVPSEGMPTGAVQVPSSGQPIVFLVDHPTTGGYPVVAVVHPHDLRRLAQARPGTRVRFHWCAR